jgi:hypothetical protein
MLQMILGGRAGVAKNRIPLFRPALDGDGV